MIKAIGLIGAGAVVGAGLMLFAIRSDRDPAAGATAPALIRALSDLASGRGGERAAATITVAERLAIYNASAATSDAAALRAELTRLASLPWSPATDVAIDAELARLSDLDPAGAAATARTLGLETGFLAEAYRAWALVDSMTAIRRLADIDDRAQRRDVALALLDVLGDDRFGLDLVARGLPDSDRGPLTIAWLSARAEREPLAALREAQQLADAFLRSAAIEQVGRAWAAEDPRGAMAQAELLAEEFKSPYRLGVVAEWARLDGDDFLGWLASTPSPPAELFVAIDYLAASRSELMLTMADGMTGNVARSLRTAAFSALAQSDPALAMTRAEGLPPGSDREMALAAVADGLARADPDAALAWAERLGSPQRLLLQITASIVRSDPDLAMDLFDDPPPGVDPQLLSLNIASLAAQDPSRVETFANRLLADNSLRAADTLRSLIRNWMQQSPERAAAWVFANESGLNAEIVAPAAEAMARVDPVGAAAYVNRVPAEYRSVWAMKVAGSYGAQDLNGALVWVEQFQGQEVYVSALRQIVSAAAQIDARAAADILSRSSTEVQLGAATQVARALAADDPRAAVRWSSGLVDAGIRREAVAAAISTWAASDGPAAQSYTLGLEPADDRDIALTSLVMQLSRRGSFDRDLLDAYSSSRAQQEALTRVIPLLAQTDAAAAEDLLGRVTSGNARMALQNQLAAIASGR